MRYSVTSKCIAAVMLFAGPMFSASGVYGQTLKTLYSFCSLANCQDGWGPSALIADPAGHLYGVTEFGGSAPPPNGNATVFELIPQKKGAWTLGKLYVFCTSGNCQDGALPFSSLIMDTAGSLYGTAEGGANSLGTVFQLTVDSGGGSWTIHSLHSFSGSDGALTSSGLTYAGATDSGYYDGTSPLFGSTEYSGKYQGNGTVYQIAPSGGGWTLTTLNDFSSKGGISPNGDLLVDASGNIFGATVQGGDEDEGVAYELTSANDSYSESVLYSFSFVDGDDTYEPRGPLIGTPSGSLYGSTISGGPHCHGRKLRRCGGGVFELSQQGPAWRYSSVYTFCHHGMTCLDGKSSSGSLLRIKSGELFGTTYSGGANGKGVVFEIAKDGEFKVLYNFCSLANCADGAIPAGRLLRLHNGRLYGTTGEGGANNAGTVFELTL